MIWPSLGVHLINFAVIQTYLSCHFYRTVFALTVLTIFIGGAGFAVQVDDIHKTAISTLLQYVID